MSRESDAVISLTFSDLERSDQSQLLRNIVSERDSAKVTIRHLYKLTGRESDDVISLTFSDLELPVLQELEGTDDWVLLVFVISSFSAFSRSRNPFLAVSQSHQVWVTSKIQVSFRFRRYC